MLPENIHGLRSKYTYLKWRTCSLASAHPVEFALGDFFSNPALSRREDILSSIHLMHRSASLGGQASGRTSPAGHPYSLSMYATRCAAGRKAHASRGDLR
jgi:hypothetical protein